MTSEPGGAPTQDFVWVWPAGESEPVIASFRLSPAEAREIVDAQIAAIESNWEKACDLGGLTDADRAYFRRRQFRNPYALEGYR